MFMFVNIASDNAWRPNTSCLLYFCPVTFEFLKDPRQTNLCCGNHLSRATAERLEAEGKPCPICKKAPLETTEDLFFKRKVMELNVRCSNRAIGCKWVGELGNLNDHLKLGSVDGLCDFVAVDCPLKCGGVSNDAILHSINPTSARNDHLLANIVITNLHTTRLSMIIGQSVNGTL